MRLFATVMAFFFALSASAQSSEATLRARLLHQPLYLRCLCAQDKLNFDATGKGSGSVDPISFTLAGVEITAVDLKASSLVLKGRRIGLEFDRQGVASRVPVKVATSFRSHDEEVRIVIAAPASNDYGQALDAVFTDKLDDLAASLPPIWQSYAAKHLNGSAMVTEPRASTEQPPQGQAPHKIGGGVTAPVVRSMPEPQFSPQARATRLSGLVLVYLQVDKDGSPSHIRILHPLGLGLDERAAGAVSQYKFTPAMQNGEPVAVEMNVEVNFQIF